MYKPLYVSREMFDFSAVFFKQFCIPSFGNIEVRNTVMKRYHPILVMILWIMLVLIVVAWTSGQFALENTPNSDPGKIDALRMHMTVGLFAGALLILRLITKLCSEQPLHAKTGISILDQAGVWAY